ncbi:extracellular catalytic domain type 1 short-chain-length polyhydroxyalkanoate depolymerase [Bacillus suaedaesalsae]|uniref:extracellular catalytic domain type 1 short-chain-length polyhydroxyalkanoate depolymerase n=1 Tax=Bacillus suaedaesalsae TaxID=2810349 RepID=UPI001EF6A021|nr:PHB depolymerase family esterase [Bacillus suaedaesalsae]
MLKVKQARHLLIILTLLISSLIPFTSTTLAAGQFLSYSHNNKSYKVYVPSGYQSGNPVPMVVMLHGCTQNPDQFATGTKMNAIAERDTFIVVYPDQPSSVNQNKCWQWFLSGHQSRGVGDPAHIAGITQKVKQNFSIDSERVYVTGLSAGAAMSVIMGATYPDIFAAIGVGAGLEYKAATSEINAYSAMSGGGPNPVQQGTAAYHAMGSYARVVPTIVFHGTSDYTVYPVNGHQVASQWVQTNDLASDGNDNNNIDDTPDETITGQVPGGRSYTKYIYKDTTGKSIVEKYMIEGMGHAWSGGDVAGSYTDPGGPNSSEIMWQFFKNNPKSGADTTPPKTTPSRAGGTFSSSLTVELNTDEPATTYYTTDGSTPTTNSTIYTTPISIHSTTTLKFFSIDGFGNKEAVKSASYTISNSSDTTAPITTASPAGGTYANSVTVQLSSNESATTYFTTDGTTPTMNSTKYTGAITLTTNTTLKFFSVDSAGNIEGTKTETYTITNTSNTVSFSSIGQEDGFVGMYLADGLSNTVLKVGDKGMSNLDTYRSILSFDTSGLDDSATISSAKLRIYRKTMTGTVNSLSLSIIKGYWSTSSNLEQSDYGATPSSNGALDILTMAVPSVNNSYTEISIPISALTYVNKNGRTQFRIKGNTSANFASDVLELYGGESGIYAPQLIITTN